MSKNDKRSPRKRARTDSLAQEPANEITHLKSKLEPEAFRIVFQLWPEKIIELSKLHETLQTTPYQPAPPVEDVDTKYFTLHPQVHQVLQDVKQQVVCLVDDLSTLISWVRFNRPKLEAGANFGVNVQHDVLGNLASGRNSAVSGKINKRESRSKCSCNLSLCHYSCNYCSLLLSSLLSQHFKSTPKQYNLTVLNYISFLLQTTSAPASLKCINLLRITITLADVFFEKCKKILASKITGKHA